MTTKKSTRSADEGPKMVRVFHPSLPSWEDVPESRVDEWVEAGWKKTAPKDVDLDVEGLPPVGSHSGFASVPVLEDTSRTVRSSTGSAAGGTTTTRGGSSASSSGTSTPSTSGGASAGATA